LLALDEPGGKVNVWGMSGLGLLGLQLMSRAWKRATRASLASSLGTLGVKVDGPGIEGLFEGMWDMVPRWGSGGCAEVSDVANVGVGEGMNLEGESGTESTGF
jgi:hypothetical protein